ncbi:hypothetical protein DFH08DRAFT_721190, partial [Mycena albidolilacea]
SKWIWTPEMAAGTAPEGRRWFRKVLTAPEGKTPIYAHILSRAEDVHGFFVNGRAVGSSSPLSVLNWVCVALRPYHNVFAVKAINTGGPAGVLATIQVTYADGTTSTVVTDASWRFKQTFEPGSDTATFDDAHWGTAFVLPNETTTADGMMWPVMLPCAASISPGTCETIAV